MTGMPVSQMIVVNLILSEQGGTVPPWLWSPDRPSLDHTAVKKGLLLTVWICPIQMQRQGMHIKC